MPLPVIAAAPLFAVSSDLILGLMIGTGTATLSVLGMTYWLYPSSAAPSDESMTPIALLIEKLNESLSRMPEYNLAQHGFFKLSNEELEKVLDIEKCSDNVTNNILSKTQEILKTKAVLEMFNTFINEADVDTTLQGLGQLLTDGHLKVLRDMQALIQQNQELKDEIQQNQDFIKYLLRIVDDKLIYRTDDAEQSILNKMG